MDSMSSDIGKSIIAGNLVEFFDSLLYEAVSKKQKSCSPFALNYVSSVLANFHEADKFFVSRDSKLPILSDLLTEAADADVYRRISILRQMGDTSLMVSGYFSEALQRRLVDLSYYHQMGETAYSQLSGLSEANNVFDELSEEFVEFSGLVSEVFANLRLEGMSAMDILNHYTSKDSVAALKRLKALGIIPLQLNKDVASEDS